MTCIASKLKLANYSTHIVGKWNVGYLTPSHIPLGRGYDTSMIYNSGGNDYFTQLEYYPPNEAPCTENGKPITLYDFWGNGKPLYDLAGTNYEEFLFENELNKLIDNFTQQTEPFFLVYAPHLIHAPQQIPKEYLTLHDNDVYNCSKLDYYVYPGFNNSNGNGVNFKCRSIYESMVTLLDTIVGNLTRRLKENNLWNNTLMIFSSDNGGPLQLPCCAANNYPLRGGKISPWEGGIRAAAFVSGGYLPRSRVGQIENGLMHLADWYTTFCSMLGIDPFDEKGAKYGLPPVEGYNVWPMISGINTTSPRTLLPIDNTTLIENNYKFIIGSNIDQASWGGTIWPNTSSMDPGGSVVGTHMDCSNGCLFDVVNDMTEHIDLASKNQQKVQDMIDTLNKLKKGFYNNSDDLKKDESCPKNIGGMQCACWMAVNKYHGYYGPFVNVDINTTQF
eukprot:264864_1